VAGTKKVETRDISPKNAKKYIVNIGENDIEPRKYNTITFYAGYNKNRKTAVVEIKEAEILILTDENGERYEFGYLGQVYVESIIEHQLGEVLSHNFLL